MKSILRHCSLQFRGSTLRLTLSALLAIFGCAILSAFVMARSVAPKPQITTQSLTSLKVAIVASDSSAWISDVQTKINATGKFSQVDIINAQSSTPTLAQLQAYDSVLVYSNSFFGSATALGNNLADYIDAGGGVVLAVFTDASEPLGGRFNSQDYYALEPQGVSTGELTLGTIHEPGSPLLAGVTSFDGGTSSYRSTGSPNLHAVRVADWSNGAPLIVRRVINGHRRVDLNFFPPSSDSRSDFWHANTDGAKIMANALVFTAISSCVPAPAGLISWWPADNTGTDVVSHYNLSLNGVGFADGKVGRAFSFDGSHIASPGTPAGLVITGTNVSIDGWIYPTAAASGFEILFGRANSGGHDYALILNTDLTGVIKTANGDPGLEHFVHTGYNPPLNTWTHVALTYDGSTITVYANGVAVASEPKTGNISDSGGPFEFGGQTGCGNCFFTGRIDEVEVFNTTLTAGQIQAIFFADTLGKCRACDSALSGLVGWWPGDGNTKDIQNGNNGLLKNGASFAPGEVNQAFSFNGGNAQEVDVPHDDNQNTGAQITLDAWIFPSSGLESGSNPHASIINKRTPGNVQGYVFEIDNENTTNGLRFEITTNNGGFGMLVPNATVADVWQHVAATYDGSTMTIYVNGVSVGSPVSATGTINAVTNDLIIGRNIFNGQSFPGLIDEVEIFNRALSAAEIQTMFDAGSVGKCKPTCVTPPSGLVGWWPGDNTATDIQSGDNGTLNGGATFAAGKVDKAFSFDGTSGSVSVPHNDNQNIQQAISIDAWVMKKGECTGNCVVLMKQADSSSSCCNNLRYGLIILDATRKVDLAFNTGSWNDIVLSNTTIQDNIWYHIAGTYDSNTGQAKIYVNGALDNTATTTGVILPSTSGPLFLGHDQTSTVVEYFNGLVDEVELFNRALSDNEIADIYNAGSAGKCKTVRFYVSNAAWIEKFDIDGIDLGTFADSGLHEPWGLAFDFSGNLFVANLSSSTIEKFDPFGTGTQFNQPGATVNAPWALAFDANGNLYATNAGSNSVTEFTSAGTDQAVFGSGVLHQPLGLAFDSTGNLFVGDNGNSTIEKFTANVDQGAFSTAAPFPSFLVFDTNGVLFASSTNNGVIREFDSAGNATTFVGGLFEPRGMAFDLEGNMYVANQGTSTLYKVDPTGNATIFASPPAAHLSDSISIAAQLLSPTAACIQFSTTSYSVNETSGPVQIVVTRNGYTGATSTVSITTAPDSAVSPDDFSAKSGTVFFDVGETSKNFFVDLNDTDSGGEGTEPSSKDFFVQLSNPSGAMLSGPSTATVTITYVNFTISVGVSGTNQGGGTTSGEGGTVSGAGSYDPGSTVDLVATPNDCFTFTSWTEGNTVVSTDPHLTFTAGGNRDLVANFTVKAGCTGACNAFATATIANVSSEYPNRPAVHVVDGSGLDSNDPPNHDIDPTHMWMTGGDGNVGSSGADPDYPAQLGHITFNLGGTFSVSSFRVWNYNENTNFAYSNRGVNTLKISTSLDGVNFTPQINPATNTTIWTFDAAPTSPTYTGQVITFPTPLTAAFVRFDILTNHGLDPEDNVDHRFVGLSEIRFNMCPVTCVPPPANMIAWWKGDGNANDSIGGHDGSLMAGATFGTGEVGQGFNFDGVAAYVTVASPVANFGTGDFTIDFWMQTTASDTREIINKRLCGDPNSDAFDVRMNGGPLLVELSRNADNTGSFFFSTRSYNDGQFHHIAIVRSGNTLSMYGDGTLDNSITNPNVGATNINNNVPLGIGGGGCSAPGGDGTHTFNGVIDEVELFDRALTPDEIAGIVRAGGLGKCECTPPPSGLVSWWPGEGDANDIQDGNNGTFTGTPAYGSGEVGQAFSFDGASYIQVPDNANLRFTSQFTLDVWINPVSTVSTAVLLIKQSSGNYSYELDLDAGGSIEADISGDGDPTHRDTLISDPGVVSAGKWTHVATTFNAGDWKIYVNGVEVKSKTSSVTSVFPGTAPFVIASTPGGYFFNGLMDEVEVFSRALTPSEVAAIYHSGSAGKCRSCTPAPTGMVSWWPGDGNGNDIQDSNPVSAGNTNGFGFGEGKVGQAFNFNGTQFVSAGNPANLNITGSQVTIDAWVNPNVDMTNEAILFGKWGDGAIQYVLEWNGGSLGGRVNNGNTEAVFTPPTGVWTHLAMVYDGSSATQSVTLYVNGAVLTSSNTQSGNINSTTSPFLIGGTSDGRDFNGRIDEVEVFNVALQASQIAAIYDAGSGGKCKPAVPAQRQLANISSRADVGTGDNVAIGGFIIQTDPGPIRSASRGSNPTKHLLIRGLGPSITGVGAPTLADPVLDLYNSQGTKIDHNDNWQEEPDGTNNPTRTAAIQATGLAPTNPNEAALLETLTSDSAYTAILSGKSGGTGIGLVEVYDLEATTNTHLHNLSTRAFVSTGDNVLIGGLIVQGDATTRILLRAIGPSLAGQGIANPLPDPVLDLHDANGTIIESNNDWGSSPEAAAISASGLAPTNSKESAILFAPAPGPYTAIMRDRNGNSGVGLIEAYWLGP